jgi:hypothetical protein
MKICFFLQRRFAYIGYALASHLNQKYGVQEFCAYVQVRQGYDFIKKQTSPHFTQVLLDEDIHNRYKNEKVDWEYLKKLERDYGLPNLWHYIEPDRIVRSSQLIRAYPYDTPPYSHEEMARIVQVKAKAITKFFEEEKPDVIIFSVVGSIDSLLLCEIAKRKNIKTLHLKYARVDIKQTISENYEDYSYVNDLFDKLQAGEKSLPEYRAEAIAYLKKFRQKPEPYCSLDLPKNRPIDRRRQFNFLKPTKLLWSIYWWPKNIVNYLLNPHRDDFSNVNPFLEIWDNFKKKIRMLYGYENFYDQANCKENFAFFPLHKEPEISTLLFATFYKDQLWLIKQISRSLPLDFKLYVKEHTAMVGSRTRNFYKELKKIPNVKLIKPTVEGLTLINEAKLILTISGTAGWEAIQLKKPVITFGDVFYNRLPMVKKCIAIERLPYLVKEQLENYKYDETALINFLTAIYHESVDVDLIQIWQIEGAGKVKTKKDQLLPLADLIAKKLNLNPIN